MSYADVVSLCLSYSNTCFDVKGTNARCVNVTKTENGVHYFTCGKMNNIPILTGRFRDHFTCHCIVICYSLRR